MNSLKITAIYEVYAQIFVYLIKVTFISLNVITRYVLSFRISQNFEYSYKRQDYFST